MAVDATRVPSLYLKVPLSCQRRGLALPVCEARHGCVTYLRYRLVGKNWVYYGKERTAIEPLQSSKVTIYNTPSNIQAFGFTQLNLSPSCQIYVHLLDEF